MGRTLVLHSANSGSILGILYGPRVLPGVITEHKAKSNS